MKPHYPPLWLDLVLASIAAIVISGFGLVLITAALLIRFE